MVPSKPLPRSHPTGWFLDKILSSLVYGWNLKLNICIIATNLSFYEGLNKLMKRGGIELSLTATETRNFTGPYPPDTTIPGYIEFTKL